LGQKKENNIVPKGSNAYGSALSAHILAEEFREEVCTSWGRIKLKSFPAAGTREEQGIEKTCSLVNGEEED